MTVSIISFLITLALAITGVVWQRIARQLGQSEMAWRVAKFNQHRLSKINANAITKDELNRELLDILSDQLEVVQVDDFWENSRKINDKFKELC